MAQLTEKQLMLAIAAGGLVLAGAAFGGVYWARGCIEEENLRISDLDRKIQDAKKKKANVKKDEEDVIILRENVTEYAKILPPQSELTDFARTINNFVMSSGVGIKSLTPVNTRGSRKAFSNFSYKMSLTGTLWQFMRFMNSFESYKRFVRVRDFSLTAGKGAGFDQNVEHGYSMTVQTYVYNKSAGGKPVQIPKYNVKRDRLREEIVKARANIKIDTYHFKGDRMRRDVFVDPRPLQREGGDDRGSTGSAPSLKEQLKIVNDLSVQVADLDKKYEEAQNPSIPVIVRYELLDKVRKGSLAIAGTIETVQDQGQIRFPAYRLKFQKDVIDPFGKLQRKFEDGGAKDNIGIPLEELSELQKQMEDDLERGHLADAKSRFASLSNKLDFPKDDPRRPIAEHLIEMSRKATVALEFQTLRLKVTGIIIVDGGLSTAIINGKTYQEGDAVGDNLFLKALGEETIEFLYKGVIIGMRR